MSYDPFVLPIELAGVQPISGIITTAMADEANAHTIQALIEISYVRTGNQILSDGLGELEEALDITQTSLDTLATLQQLHNSVTVSSLSAFDFDFETKLSDNGISTSVYQEEYLKWASAYFGTPILPNFLFETADVAASDVARGTYTSFSDFSSQLATAKQTLSENITALRGITSGLDASGNPLNPNTLLAKLIVVYDNLPPVVGDAISYNDAKVWALDTYTAYEGVDLAQSDVAGDGGRLDSDGNLQNPYTNYIESSYLGTPTDRGNVANAGLFQQNIQFAVTAAQSLNDSQKERVRRFLFVFEEFYKSASTMLSLITKIIEKIAQGIRPA